jgi:hypothetical protein
MRIKLQAVAVLLLAAMVAPSASGLPIMIDNFEQGDFVVADVGFPLTPTVGEQSGLLTSNVAGGVRLVRTTAQGLTAAGNATLVTTGGDDSVLLTTTSVAGSTDYQFIYDGNANGLSDGINGVLGLNMAGFLSVEVTASVLLAGPSIRLTIWTSTSQSSTAFKPLVNGVNSFSLIGGGFGALNLADVQAIQVSLQDISPASVVGLTKIEAIPEPTTGLLLSLGLVGIAAARRRSQV